MLGVLLLGCMEPAESTGTESTNPLGAAEVESTVSSRSAELQTLVDSCEDYVGLKADLGDATFSQLERDMATDEGGLDVWCEQLATNDPASLGNMLDEYESITQFLAQTAAAPPATMPPATAPPATAPPATAAPIPQPIAGGGCDPNYGGCVPIASDVDCAGGSGNGPAYTNGPVAVIGQDIYDLDRDGDGWGCD